MISLIAAHDRNRIIGAKGSMPWHLPKDLAHFKRQTLGKPMVMGRKTFESIGGVLPGRETIVLTRDRDFKADGAEVFSDYDEAVRYAEGRGQEVMIIGGEQLFRRALPTADALYITYIDAEFEGDTVFPEYGEGWVLEEESEREHSEDGIPYSFRFYRRAETSGR